MVVVLAQSLYSFSAFLSDSSMAKARVKEEGDLDFLSLKEAISYLTS